MLVLLEMSTSGRLIVCSVSVLPSTVTASPSETLALHTRPPSTRVDVPSGSAPWSNLPGDDEHLPHAVGFQP